MNKDTVPQNYTMGLAIFDFVPVLFFGLASYLLWKMTGSFLVLLGGLACFISGALKVLWKIIVVAKKKNIWPLFVQMRIGMPAGLNGAYWIYYQLFYKGHECFLECSIPSFTNPFLCALFCRHSCNGRVRIQIGFNGSKDKLDRTKLQHGSAGVILRNDAAYLP